MFKKWRKSPFEKEKVFCIGLNKTGTTSLEETFKSLGYTVGDQVKGELLLKEYAVRNFNSVIGLCHTADAFQDAPFSFPYTFVLLDHYFPNAKFILTVRDTPDQWYSSMVKFHSNLWGNGKVPTKEVLMNTVYHYKGRPWESSRILFNTPEDDVYNKEKFLHYYNTHNDIVREYFRMKTNLFEMNISEPGTYLKMCKFLGKEPVGTDFPWLNKS